jgi:hypothetical protein
MAAGNNTTDRVSIFTVWKPLIFSHYMWLDCGLIAKFYIHCSNYIIQCMKLYIEEKFGRGVKIVIELLILVNILISGFLPFLYFLPPQLYSN